MTAPRRRTTATPKLTIRKGKTSRRQTDREGWTSIDGLLCGLIIGLIIGRFGVNWLFN